MFQIDPMSRVPIYEQLISQIERYIASGVLKPLDRLPSVRSMSSELSINPNTIQKTYFDLDTRGVVTTVQGKGCFISENAPELVRQRMLGENSSLYKTLSELKSAGITRDEMMEMVNTVYGTDGKENNL